MGRHYTFLPTARTHLIFICPVAGASASVSTLSTDSIVPTPFLFLCRMLLLPSPSPVSVTPYCTDVSFCPALYFRPLLNLLWKGKDRDWRTDTRDGQTSRAEDGPARRTEAGRMNERERKHKQAKRREKKKVVFHYLLPFSAPSILSSFYLSASFFFPFQSACSPPLLLSIMDCGLWTELVVAEKGIDQCGRLFCAVLWHARGNARLRCCVDDECLEGSKHGKCHVYNPENRQKHI